MDALPKSRLVEKSAAAMLIFSQSFNGLVAIALVSDLPVIARHFAGSGNGEFFAQMVMVAPAISIIIGSPLAGTLARFVGPRRLMTFSLLVYVLAGIFGVLAPGRAPLLISRIVLGLVSSFLTTLATSEASEFEVVRRDKLLGLASATAGTTAIIGILAAGWLTSRFGWTAPFILYLWPLPLLPALLLSIPKHAPTVDNLRKDGFLDPLRAAWPVYLLSILLCLIFFAPAIEGPFVMAARGMTDPSIIGLVISANIVVTVASSATFGWLSQRISANGMVLIVLGFFFASSLIMTFSTQVWAAEAGIVVAGLGGGQLAPMLMSRVLKNVPSHQAATALGWFLSTLYGSQMADPVLFNLIRRFLPFPVFGTIAIVCCIAIAAFIAHGLQGRFRSGAKQF